MSQKPIFSFLIFMLQSIFHIRSTYNFKKCTFTLKMGANDASGEGLHNEYYIVYNAVLLNLVLSFMRVDLRL
jgi:hypothetical protein